MGVEEKRYRENNKAEKTKRDKRERQGATNEEKMAIAE